MSVGDLLEILKREDPGTEVLLRVTTKKHGPVHYGLTTDPYGSRMGRYYFRDAEPADLRAVVLERA